VAGKKIDSVASAFIGGRSVSCQRDFHLPPSRAKRASASLAGAFGEGGKVEATRDFFHHERFLHTII
jgi:hypothetical protein